jgi:hypothetical protein
LSDGLSYLAARRPEWTGPLPSSAAAALAVLLVVLGGFDMARQAGSRYQSLEALQVGGLGRIHVPADVGRAMSQLVRAVSAQGCSKLFTVPSMFSLNLWTRTKPLTFAAGNWVNATGDEFQQNLIEMLRQEPGTCVIYSRQLLKEWQSPNDPDRTPPASEDVFGAPVVRFLTENYRPQLQLTIRPRSDYDMDYQFLTPVSASQAGRP